MIKVEIIFSDDQRAIHDLRVTFPDGHHISLSPFPYAGFVGEAHTLIEDAVLVEKTVKQTDWAKAFPPGTDKR